METPIPYPSENKWVDLSKPLTRSQKILCKLMLIIFTGPFVLYGLALMDQYNKSPGEYFTWLPGYGTWTIPLFALFALVVLSNGVKLNDPVFHRKWFRPLGTKFYALRALGRWQIHGKTPKRSLKEGPNAGKFFIVIPPTRRSGQAVHDDPDRQPALGLLTPEVLIPIDSPIVVFRAGGWFWWLPAFIFGDERYNTFASTWKIQVYFHYKFTNMRVVVSARRRKDRREFLQHDEAALFEAISFAWKHGSFSGYSSYHKDVAHMTRAYLSRLLDMFDKLKKGEGRTIWKRDTRRWLAEEILKTWDYYSRTSASEFPGLVDRIEVVRAYVKARTPATEPSEESASDTRQPASVA